MNKISTRQLCFFLAAIVPVGKIVLLPTNLIYYSKNNLLFPAAMNIILQAGIVFLVLLLAKENRPLYELISDKLGKVTAKIILTVFSIFFFYAAFMPLLEQKILVQGIFYDTLPSILAFSSFFAFSAYLCAKPLSSLGRTWDILAPLSIVAFSGIFFLSIGSADFGALAPALQSGAGEIFRGFAFNMGWFLDSAILLSFLGKIDYQKGLPWKGLISYLAGGAAVLFFLAIFYGVFQETAINQEFAFSKIAKYFPGIETLGRIDFIFVYSLSLVMAFYAILPLQAGIDLLQQSYGKAEKRLLPALLSIAVNIVMLVLTLLFDHRYISLNFLINQDLFWIFPIFCLLLPALMLLFKIRRHHEPQ